MAEPQVAFKPQGFLSKRRLAWAGGAALLGCVACCTLPLLVVAGGGGLLASLASFLHPGSELLVGGVVFVSALALGAIASPRQSKLGTSCGCAPGGTAASSLFRSPAPGRDEPISCTADLRDKPAVQDQMNRYRAAFTHLVSTERFPGGIRWRFRLGHGLEQDLRLLAEREHECCRFFQFDLSKVGNELHWETRADDRAAAMLDEFSRLPERLRDEPRPGHDLISVKRSAEAAGLVFVADSKQT